MDATSVLIACLLSFVLGAAFMAVGLWFRDQTADAERWGERLGIDPPEPRWLQARGEWTTEDLAAVARGLEDVKLSVKPLMDWEQRGDL